MLDWEVVSGFDWDDGNSEKNLDKHGVEKREAEEVFADPRLILARDVAHSVAEDRFHGFGATRGGRLLHVAFTLRGNGTLIRIISARDMSRSERRAYAEEG